MKEVNDLNFKEIVLDSKTPIIVDFWAEWCGPCRVIKPIMEQLDELYKEKIEVIKCDVDRSPNTSKQYNIFSIPTVMFFKDGEMKDKQVGAHQLESYVDKINEIYKF